VRQLFLGVISCCYLISVKRPERVRFHPPKARHSLTLQRVKGDTALNPVYGCLGINTSSSQPAHIARQLLPRTKLGSLSKRKYFYCPQVSTNCDGNSEIGKRTKNYPVSLHRARSDSNRRNSTCTCSIAS